MGFFCPAVNKYLRGFGLFSRQVGGSLASSLTVAGLDPVVNKCWGVINRRGSDPRVFNKCAVWVAQVNKGLGEHLLKIVRKCHTGSQVASGTYAGIYLRPSDIGCQYSRSIYTACFIVWQPHCAADTSTNWRQSLFCCCTASMEQATD